MAIENDPSARMQVLSRGELNLPGTCYVCGNGTCEEGYLDFNTFIDYHGNFYLCMTCAVQAAETIGCFTPEQVALMNELGEKAAEKVKVLEQELANARPILDAFEHAMRLASPSLNLGDPVVNPDAGPGILTVEPTAPAITEGAAGGKPETEELNPFSGPANPRRSKSRNITSK